MPEQVQSTHRLRIESVPIPGGRSHRIYEDGKTLLVIAVLRDGKTVAITVCPSEPITATEIEVECV